MRKTYLLNTFRIIIFRIEPKNLINSSSLKNMEPNSIRSKIPPPDREGIFLKLYYFWTETRILWRTEVYEYISNFLTL